jgi:predicted ester cyclase
MTTKVWPRRSAIAAIVVSGLLACGTVLRGYDPQTPPPAHATPADAFALADLDFRGLYAGGRAATLAKIDPLIVVELDSLILIHDGRRTEVKVIPPLYHRLKAVSHIPLAVYVSLAPYATMPLEAERLDRLRTFRTRVVAVLEAFDQSGFLPAQSQRSRLILERCRAFLDGVLSAGKYDPAELQALTRAAGPVVLANVGDAARAQIDAYHAQVAAWRREMPPGVWGRLRVVVLGQQMARRHNVAVQYFAKLMGLPDESRRLVFAEELSGERQGLNLLATHQLDSELAEAFFGSPDRMEIDLLGNAASVYLDGFDFSR